MKMGFNPLFSLEEMCQFALQSNLIMDSVFPAHKREYLIRKTGTSLHFCASPRFFLIFFRFWGAVMSIWLCEYSVFFALSPRGHKYFVFVLKIKIYFCKINFLSDSLFVEFCCAYFFLAGPKFAYQQRVSFVSSSCLMGPKTVRDMCLGTHTKG